MARERRRPEARGAGASGVMAVPEGLTWRRVHPITPLLEGWKIIAAVLAFFSLQNLDTVIEVARAMREAGFSLSAVDARTLVMAGVGAAGAVVIVATWLVLGWAARSWAVDADAVYVRTGILAKQLRIARLPRIQSVDVVHPLLGRIFGLGQLVVEVAGGSDSHVTIGYLRSSELEDLRRLVLDLAAGGSTAVSQPPAATAAAGGASSEACATAPVGFEDGGDSAARLHAEVEDTPLYTVDVRVLIGSIVRSLRLWTVAVVLLVSGGGTLAVALWEAERFDLDLLLNAAPALVLPLALGSMVVKDLSGGWGFRAAATPAGIRLRHGLTSEVSTTLPPGRVHAVTLSQGALWRRKDWWKVDATVAGRSARTGEDSTADSCVLLPVGERETALRALWLVLPDLGTPDPDGVLEAALTGLDDAGVGDLGAPIASPERGFVRVSPRARWCTPLGLRRTAVLVTDTCVIVRTGRLWRRVTVIPLARVQSLKLRQGPVARRWDLAGLSFDMVSLMVGGASVANLDASEAAVLERVISARALRRGHEESLDRWLARATA